MKLWNNGETVEEKKEKPPLSEQEKIEQPERIELLKTEHDDLLRKAGELLELRDRYLRSAADFENAKKRLLKERDDLFKYVLESVVFDLLPVLDNMERALRGHVGEVPENAKPLYNGFMLIHKQLTSALAEHGLKRLEVLGKSFDPHQHEAVDHIVSDQAEGFILEEVVAGYELKGRLIRPAKVKIATKKEENKGAK